MRKALYAVGGVLVAIVALVAVALVVIQSEWAERWIEARVASHTGREVEIDGIDLDLGWPPVVNVAHLRIGNPSWAKTPNLVDASSLSARVEVLPLFRRRIVMPFLSAEKATAGLEIDGERATWRFSEQPGARSPFAIRRIEIGDGEIAYRREEEKTALDVAVKGSAGEGGELRAEATGRFRGEPVKASARIPALATSPDAPIRLVGTAKVGRTELGLDGTLGAKLDAIDADVKLAGGSLRDLRSLFRVSLPDTPPYRVAGHLRRNGGDWHFDRFEGKVGDSDVAGDVQYRKEGEGTPFLRAALKSQRLDLDDVLPAVGAPPNVAETATPEQKRRAAEVKASGKVLPSRGFESERWSEIDADVTLDAARVNRPQAVPIDALSMHIVLKDSVLKLDPLKFGLAGGKAAGLVVVDAQKKPARGNVTLDVQGVKLSRMFPKSKEMTQSFGTLYGKVKLAGQGTTLADLLASSDGQIALAIDGGEVSLLMVELMGIDIAEALQLLGTRNRKVTLRCAVADIPVKDGVASPQAFVVDTTDTIVWVGGDVKLGEERLDLVFHPEPKDPSIFALRSPIHLSGSFRDPNVRPEIGPIAARVAGAIALGAINPVLALVPFIETGPGKDSDCAKLIGSVRSKGAQKKAP